MTTKGIWKSNWIRGVKVTEVTWIGKDIMAWCSGLFIIFYNVKKNQQFLRWCSKSSEGEGACCISSHLNLSLFAYAEKVMNPRILVYSYPSMTKISECSRGSRVGYLATNFAGEDFLVSLGTYPSFFLIVWSWRTGEKIKSISTLIQDAENQILRTNYEKPILMAQMGQQTGRLCIWDVAVAGKLVILKDHEIVLPEKALVSDVNWCPNTTESILAITDTDGHIYLSNGDGTVVERIVVSQRCGVCLIKEPAAVCWFGGGIVLRTTFCQIRFYRKNDSGVWHKQWYVKTTTRPCFLTSHPFRNNRLFFHTLEGHVKQLAFLDGQEAPVINTRIFYGASVKHVDFVYPWGHHLVIVDNPMSLNVIESHGGTEVIGFDFDLLGDITCLASHPDYPMVVVTSSQGEVIFVSLLDPLKPRTIAQYRLHSDNLDLLKFSQSGRFLMVGDKADGILFCIKLSKRKSFSVIGTLSVGTSICDLFAFEANDSLRVFVLQKTVNQVFASHQILVYEKKQKDTEFSDIIRVLHFKECYRNLEYVPGNPFLLIGKKAICVEKDQVESKGIPCHTKQLHVLSLQNWQDLNIVEARISGHQMKQSFLFCDRQWITSSGTDGLVIVRDKAVQTTKIFLRTHHVMDLGVIKSMVRVSGDILAALGADGSLVSLKYCKIEDKVAEEKKNLQEVLYYDYANQKTLKKSDYYSLDPIIVEMLSRPLQKLESPEELMDLTWIELVQEEKIREEEARCATKRALIMSEFESLRTKVVKLIDENEVCPELEKLPLAAFNLDKVSREQKIKAARDEREDIRLELEHNCVMMNRLWDWIKTKFWDTQVNLTKSIFSIFGSTEIQNFTYEKSRFFYKDQERWATFSNDVINELRERDSFAPWFLYTALELTSQLEKVGRLHTDDEKKLINVILEAPEEEIQSITEKDFENQQESEGLTTYRFVEPCKQITQFACYSYSQFRLDSIFQEIDAKKIQDFWNQQFEEMFEVKEREISIIRERIEKIEYIDSELRLMFGRNVPEMPVYPKWKLQEVPENIIITADDEVPVKPYVSSSEQEILDQKAAEAERIRLRLLADDFRERALIKMMDGVLEIRWEDIIKKDIPKPACMLKASDQYKKEDIVAIAQYEKAVETLAQDRERYRRILEADFVKVNGMLKEGIDKFNSRLDEAFQLRMKVESALKQQNLKYARYCMRHLQRIEFMKRENKIREIIKESQLLLNELNEQSRQCQAIIPNLQNQYDNFCLQEKSMEKKFKDEFPGLKKGALDNLHSQYKRRPRINLKNSVPNDLLDLASAVATLKKPAQLPVEFLDYLNGLDHLDVRPNKVPASVTNNHWNLLVRLRRLKIDIELKIKAQELEVNKANNTLLSFNQKVSNCKSHIETLKKELIALRKESIEIERNIEIQLVLKMGQVEIKPQLTRHDTKNSVFIPRSEILKVNERILTVGHQKLKIMKRALNFKRGIALKEWEHKCLRMKIDDLKEDLYSIQRIQVTRPIQLFLKRKAKGFPDNKTPQNLERHLEANKRAFEKILKEWVLKLEDVEKSIEQVKEKNELLDRKIMKMNVVRCEMEMKRDLVGEAKHREFHEKKMAMFMKRSALVRKLQNGFTELLALQTEHERLKTREFPMLPMF